MSRPRRIVLVSDLHLGAGDTGDPFRRDADFVDFCRHLAGPPVAERGARRLVVLGDFLELLGVRAPTAVEGVDRIADAHQDVFGALAGLVGTGWDIDVVTGNHDVELLRPEVRHRLRALLDPGQPGSGRVGFHPWILHVPGVLYAEHGHQYHDINWFPAMAWAAGRDGAGEVRHPLGAKLGGPRPALAGALVRNAAGRLLGTSDPRRRQYRRTALAAIAPDIGLGAGTLRRIDRLPRASTAAMVHRLAAPALGRGPAPYLHRAATRIDRILRERGAGCAAYAFGHSHVAECLPLGDGPARYVNPGTWCRHVRGPLGHACDGEQATYAVIDCPEAAPPVVSVRPWRRCEEMVATEQG
jgi:hypothetical protein